MVSVDVQRIILDTIVIVTVIILSICALCKYVDVFVCMLAITF